MEQLSNPSILRIVGYIKWSPFLDSGIRSPAFLHSKSLKMAVRVQKNGTSDAWIEKTETTFCRQVGDAYYPLNFALKIFAYDLFCETMQIFTNLCCFDEIIRRPAAVSNLMSPTLHPHSSFELLHYCKSFQGYSKSWAGVNSSASAPPPKVKRGRLLSPKRPFLGFFWKKSPFPSQTVDFRL